MEEIKYEFSAEKNTQLQEQRGISFEEVIYYISNGYLLDTIQHHNKEKYAGQQFYVVDIEGYVYLVPFVRQNDKIFLKTIFPSRKHTKQYLDQMKGGEERAMSKKHYDIEKHEQDVLEDFEKGEFVSVNNAKKESKLAKQAANNFMKRDNRINIRISGADLNMVRRIAVQEGLPYQTLLASVIHKFVTGRLVDKGSSSQS